MAERISPGLVRPLGARLWMGGVQLTSVAQQTHARPFLRWPGGKRGLAPAILLHFPTSMRTYYEPFLGSGAMFFAVRPRRAMLSDSNSELINAFEMVRDKVEAIIDRLDNLEQDADTFYRLRATVPEDSLDRAVRFVFLNRTAFNGLWRVNRDGEFNVPYGKRQLRDLVKADTLRAASNSLSQSQLKHCDFALAVKKAGDGDLVYLDPPYTVKHELNGFRRYNESLFSWGDQERLSDIAKAVAARGAKVIVSNASHPSVASLYKGSFREITLERSSRLAADPIARSHVRESLFVSDG